MKIIKSLFTLFTFLLIISAAVFANPNTIRVHLSEVKAPYTINIKGPYKAYNYKYESEIVSSLTNETVIVTEHRLGLKVNDVGIYKEGIVFDTEDGFTLNGVEYYGSLKFIPYNGDMIAINELNIEDYVKGVLPHEMSPDWPMEALKSQAVAARTYAIFHILKNNNKLPYDVDNTTKYQVYNGREKINWNIEQAADRTKYEIAVYGDKVIATYFSALCGGHTDSAKNVFGTAVPYLEGVQCRYCNAQIRNWTNALSFKELNDDFVNYSVNADEKSSFGITMDPKSGKAMNIRIDDNDISSKDFRAVLSPKLVPSLNFTINKIDNGIIITGKGSGHGVGMCQWGAYGMAQVKKDYKEILKFYYKGINIVDYNNINKTLEPDIWIEN